MEQDLGNSRHEIVLFPLKFPLFLNEGLKIVLLMRKVEVSGMMVKVRLLQVC